MGVLEDAVSARSLVDPIRFEERSGYSDVQQIIAYITIAMGGIFSLVASLTVIYYILTSVRHNQDRKRSEASEHADHDAPREGGKRKHHRSKTEHPQSHHNPTNSNMPCEMALTLASAILNVITSGCFIFFDAFVPDDDFSSLYFYWNRGSEASCKVMAFLQQLQLSNVYFGAAVALYYYLSMVKGDFRFDGKKKSQRTLLAVATGIPLLSAVLMISVEGGNLVHSSATLGCYVQEDFLDTQDSLQDATVLAWFLVLTVFPVAFCSLFMVFAVVKIAIYIRHLRHVIDEMAEAATTKAKGDIQNQNDSHSMRQLEQRISKMTHFVHLEKDGLTTVALHLALAVVGNLFLIVNVLVSFRQPANDDPPYALRIFQSLFFPMTGWFRCWVFLRPKISQYKKFEPQSISYFEATRRVLLHRAHSSDDSEKESGRVELKRRQSAASSDIENFEDDGLPPQDTHGQEGPDVERGRPENPRLKRLAQQQHQQQQVQAIGSIALETQDTHNGVWSYANENQARQLARAMSSRRGLQGLVDDDGNSDTHTRQLARAISSRRNFGRNSTSIRASSRGGLSGMRNSRLMVHSPSTTVSASSDDRKRIQEKVREEQKPGFPPQRNVIETEQAHGEVSHKEGQSSLRDNTYHHAGGHLGSDTSHTTGSWSKMEFSGHPVSKVGLFRSHRGDDGSRNSFSSVDR